MLLLSLTALRAGAADGYAAAAGLAIDEAGGWSVSALADIGFTPSNGITLAATRSEADIDEDTLVSRYLTAAFRQDFGAFGIRLGAGTWGDPDRLESRDLEAGVYWDTAHWHVGVDVQRRDIDLELTRRITDPIDTIRTVTAEATADGIGGSVRYRGAGEFSVSLRGRRYDYDRNLNLLQFVDFIRLISPTTLTLAGSLRLHEVSAGIEWGYRDSVLGVELTQDRVAVGEFDVVSLSGLWLLPAGKRSDIEFSVGVSRVEDGDSTVFAGLLFYFYGR